MNNVKHLLSIFLSGSLISTILVIFISMRSSQLSQQEEAQHMGYAEDF